MADFRQSIAPPDMSLVHGALPPPHPARAAGNNLANSERCAGRIDCPATTEETILYQVAR